MNRQNLFLFHLISTGGIQMMMCKVYFLGGESLPLFGEAAEYVYNKLKFETQIPNRLFIKTETKQDYVIFTEKVTYLEKSEISEEEASDLRRRFHRA
jgi:hypothetical protein